MEHNQAVSAEPTEFGAPAAPTSGPFVVNLCSSLAPIEIKSTSLPGLERFRLYQVRRVEEDRPRYRLRLGFFADETATEMVLSAVRDVYPAAFVVAAGSDDLKHAPGFDLASMGPRLPVRTATESTGTYLRSQAQMAPRPVTPVAHPVTPTSVLATTRASVSLPFQRSTTLSAPAAVDPASPPKLISLPAPTLELAAESALPAAGGGLTPTTPTPFRVKAADPSALGRAPDSLDLQPEAQVRAAKPDRASPVRAGTGAVLIDSTQTLRLLTESELSDPQAPQFYAVQLAESDQPINLDTMPTLDIFAAFRLYSIAHTRHGKIVHSMRLGFFKESVSAEAVAGYLKTFFSMPGVMRVSAAEHSRFANPPLPPVLNDSAGKAGKVVHLHENRGAAKGPVTAPVLKEGINQTGERPGLPPRTAAKEPAAPAAAKPAPPAQAMRKPAPASGMRPSTRARSLNEQLLEEARKVVLSESGIRQMEHKGSLLSRLVGKLTR